MVKGQKSRSVTIDSGVPEGGVMSGIMFNLYINDLPKSLKYMIPSMYADDTKIYAAIQNEKSINDIQEDIDAVVAWCKTWRLKLNAQKCFYLHYKPQKTENLHYPELKLDDTTLERRTVAKDPRVIISDKFKFNEQVAAACKKANREIGIIRRTFVSRNPKSLENMFKCKCNHSSNTVYSCGTRFIRRTLC